MAARSQFCAPGPIRGFACSIPKWPNAGANDEVENHCAAFLVLLMEPTWTGRMEVVPLTAIPNPSGPTEMNGSFGCVTSNDEPEINELIPDSSQPPRACPARPCC